MHSVTIVRYDMYAVKHRPSEVNHALEGITRETVCVIKIEAKENGDLEIGGIMGALDWTWE